MYFETYYTRHTIKNVVDSNKTINKFINAFINKNNTYYDSINYAKYYCCYKNYNCSYDHKIMEIILNIIK